MTAILLTPETLARCSIYVLIEWPYVHDLMSQEWFHSECILYENAEHQQHLASAYFVPLLRFADAMQQGLISLQA